MVKAIGDEEDVARVDLDGVLPSSAIMVVTVTASTTAGRPLSGETLNKVLEGEFGRRERSRRGGGGG